jgi:hypothetical protein
VPPARRLTQRGSKTLDKLNQSAADILSECDWEPLTLSGFEALTAGDPELAAKQWSLASDSMMELDPSDSRHAAAANNAGVASLLCGDPQGALRCFREALELWRAFEPVLDRLTLPVAGRASAFHLVLGARHQEVYEKVRRQKLRELVSAAEGISSVNLAVAQWRTSGVGLSPTVFRDATARILAVFGRAAPEIEELRRLQLIVCGKQAGIDVQRQDGAGGFGRPIHARWSCRASRTWQDIRSVSAAAHLTALMLATMLEGGPRKLDGSNYETSPLAT